MAVQPWRAAMFTLKTSDLFTGAAVAALASPAGPALADGMAHESMDWLALFGRATTM